MTVKVTYSHGYLTIQDKWWKKIKLSPDQVKRMQEHMKQIRDNPWLSFDWIDPEILE